MSKSKVIKFPKCKITLHYKADDESALDFLEKIEEGYRKGQEFFDYDLKRSIDICLVYSRDEMNKRLGKEKPSWFIANTSMKDGSIVIFSPDAVEKHSNHRKEDIFKTIQHELIHTFQMEVVSGFTPWWLDEGVALILADQIKINGVEFLKSLIKTGKFFDYTDENYRFCTSNGGYPAAYFLLKNLIKDFGRSKIRSLFENDCTNENFDNFFEKEIGMSPEGYVNKITE